MQIVKDGRLKRQYYTYLKYQNKVEYRSMYWFDSIEKYCAGDKFNFELTNGETWSEFKERHKKDGYVETEKCIPIRK